MRGDPTEVRERRGEGLFGKEAQGPAKCAETLRRFGRADALEKILQSADVSDEDKLAAMTGFFMLLIHETGHYGDRNELRKRVIEVGDDIEKAIWGGKNYDPYSIDTNKEANKWNPETQKAIVKEQQAKPEGKRSLPRVPKKEKKQ